MKQFSSFLQRKRFVLSALFILFAFLLFCKCFLACQTFSADDTFETFTEELFRQELASNTISLHYTLTDPSKYELENSPVSIGEYASDSSALASTLNTYITALEKFSDVELSSENQLTYDILHSYLLSSREGLSYLLFEEPLSPVTGIHAQLPILLSEYQFYSKEDVDIYLQLLSQIGTYFDSILAFEIQKKEAGIFMPDYQIESVLGYCNSFVEMGESNYLHSSFEERLSCLTDLSEAEKKDLISQNKTLIKETVFPAYQKLISSLATLKGSGTNEMGLCYFPNGKEYYEYLAQSESGLSESVPEMQAMTKTQITEDLIAIENVLLKSSADVYTEEDSILTSTPDQILDDLKNKSLSSFPEVPSVNVEIKFVSSAMEEYLSPAFYMIPAIDNTEENVIYINKGQTVEGLNLYTTLAHEGYPGHLYQTIYFSSTNPSPIRSILNFGGYVEGWATYAEMMSYYLAPLSKTDATLLQKNNSIILGLYAYADMGIHYDGWTLEDTISFFGTYGISDAETIQEIYELIIGTPANYVKYYMGYLKFYTLKKEVAAKLGKNFSQINYHKAVLDVGPAPFEIVTNYVTETLF